MSMEIFNRVEKKFMLSTPQVNKIIDKLKSEMTCDVYSENDRYMIQNIYYDTDDSYLIKHSLSKPQFKEKLRIRAYGEVDKESLVFIELKKKINGVVNKRRSKIKLSHAYEFIRTKTLPTYETYQNRMVLREIQVFLTRYDLVAKSYISYQRLAFKSGQLRVTMDYNILTRDYDLALESGSFGEALLEDQYHLLEAKSQYGLPIWFTKLLSETHVYKTSFSKYGKDFLRRNRGLKEKGITLCLNQSLVTHQQQHSLS